jgi:hypothetical protein
VASNEIVGGTVIFEGTTLKKVIFETLKVGNARVEFNTDAEIGDMITQKGATGATVVFSASCKSIYHKM